MSESDTPADSAPHGPVEITIETEDGDRVHDTLYDVTEQEAIAFARDNAERGEYDGLDPDGDFTVRASQ